MDRRDGYKKGGLVSLIGLEGKMLVNGIFFVGLIFKIFVV